MHQTSNLKSVMSEKLPCNPCLYLQEEEGGERYCGQAQDGRIFCTKYKLIKFVPESDKGVAGSC